MNATGIIRYPVWAFLFSVIIAGYFFYNIPNVRNVEDVDHFIIKDDPDNKYYEHFKEEFGNDEFFLISFSDENLFSHEKLTLIKQVTEALESISEVEEVKSLYNIEETIGHEDYFEVREFLEEIPEDQHALGRLKKRALSNNIFLNNFISVDGKTTAIAVNLYERPDDDHYRMRVIQKTHEILKKYGGATRFYLAGKTVTDTTMSEYMEKDVSFLLPLSYILIAFCIFYFYRNVILTVLGIVNISFCLGCVTGFMGATDITQNSVTSIVLPLIMALALCDTMHIYSHMTPDILSNFPDRRSALKEVLNKVFKPCLMTSLTTMAGFLSLYTSQLPPIKEFALVASAGIFFEFLFSFFLIPPLVLLVDPNRLYKSYHSNNFVGYFLETVSNIVFRNKAVIVITTFILMASSVYFATHMKIETNVIKFFKQDTDIRVSLQYVETHLSGIESLDITLKADESDLFKRPENLKLIDDIQRFVDSVQGVDKTLSLVDFMKNMNQSFHNENPDYYTIPKSSELVAQYLLLYDSDEIDDFINSDYNYARISVRISEHNATRQQMIMDTLDQYLKGLSRPGINFRITGRMLQDVNVINDIFWGQIKSLGLAGIIIWGLMFFLFRSLKMGLISILPNIFPIVMNFGIMGALGIPLNTATALISAVAIGIAVDDTIHFLNGYLDGKNNGLTSQQLVHRVISQKGRAILASSLILCIGFGVLVFSSFIPTIHFGILCACIMLSALIADLFFLPALLLLYENSNK